MGERRNKNVAEPGSLSRRSLLKAGAATVAAHGLAALGAPRASASLRSSAQRTRVAVVGAGAFGGWTALYLLRRGANVTLLDTWGPGQLPSELRGRDAAHPKPSVRSGAHVQQTRHVPKRLPGRGRASGAALAGERETLEASALPAVRFACQEVLRGFLEEGGEYRQLSVAPPDTTNGPIRRLMLGDGSTLEADQYVFACGPWLGRIFPDVVHIRALRQETFFFGTPPGEPRFLDTSMPTWRDATTTPGHLGAPRVSATASRRRRGSVGFGGVGLCD